MNIAMWLFLLLWQSWALARAQFLEFRGGCLKTWRNVHSSRIEENPQICCFLSWNLSETSFWRNFYYSIHSNSTKMIIFQMSVLRMEFWRKCNILASHSPLFASITVAFLQIGPNFRFGKEENIWVERLLQSPAFCVHPNEWFWNFFQRRPFFKSSDWEKSLIFLESQRVLFKPDWMSAGFRME